MRGDNSSRCSPRHLGPTLPTEMCVPGLQLRGDLSSHLFCTRGLCPCLLLPWCPALGLEEQCGQLQ